VRPLSAQQRDDFYADNQVAARLYGVETPPASQRELEALFERMRPQLEPSPIVLEFLEIMRAVPLLPGPLRPLHTLLLKAAVQAVPEGIRDQLGLGGSAWRLAPWQWWVVRALGRAGDHLTLPSLPARLALRRMATAAPAQV